MKRFIVLLFFLGTLFLPASGQVYKDSLVINCIASVEPTSKYLKDFIIMLGPGTSSGDFRYKARLPLRKNIKYRFIMCNAIDSDGRLLLNLRDEEDQLVLSSLDMKTGTIYPQIDFLCKKNGIYRVCFDFSGEGSGSGVSIVLMMK